MCCLVSVELIAVELACPAPDGYRVLQLTLPAGASPLAALQAGGVERLPDWTVGVFGRPVAWDTRLVDGDRVEVYLPLRVDPKTARRRRAAANEKKSRSR